MLDVSKTQTYMYVKFKRWSRNYTFIVNSLDFGREQTFLQNSSGVISNVLEAIIKLKQTLS